MPDNSDRPYSYAITTPGEVSPAIALFKPGQQPRPGDSGFLLLEDGLDAFAARAVLADRAAWTIDAEYFMLQDDLVGRSFIGVLARAADRGVRVRLLLDDFWQGTSDFELSAYDAHPNIEIRIINPFSRNAPRATQVLTRFGAVTRRMHNKSFVVDNQLAIVGGRNIGNGYFEANPEIAFDDLDVLAVGPIVHDVSGTFDQYWNSDLSYPIARLAARLPGDEEAREAYAELLGDLAINAESKYADDLRNSNLFRSIEDEPPQFVWAPARVIADAPEKLSESRLRTDLHLIEEMRPLFEGAQEEIIIFTPYLVPGANGVAILGQLVDQGMRVRILTNALATNNHPMVHAHYAKRRRAMLRAGIELYEIHSTRAIDDLQRRETVAADARMLHAKGLVFDRSSVFIGSFNLAPRSVVENTEIGIVVESEELGQEIGDWFDNNIEQIAYRLRLQPGDRYRDDIVWKTKADGRLIQFTTEPDSSLWARVKMRLMRFIPVESQL